MGEFGFRQSWEFRRNDENDPDSSFNDLISSDGSLIRKQKLVSRLISLGDDETSEGSRLEQKEDENPGKAGQINFGKVKKRTARNKSSSKMKKDSPEEVDLQKGETSGHNHAPLDELKNFIESLLKDLKVTRESLLKWMIDEVQQLVGDLRRKPDHVDERVRLQKRKKSSKDQHGKTHMESMQSYRSSNSDKCIQVQCYTDLQLQNSSQEKNKQQVPIQDKENNNLQPKNDFGYGMDRSLGRFPTGVTAPASTGYLNPLGDRLGTGQFVELITSSNRKGDSLSTAAAKLNHQTSDAGQNVQAKSNTSVVLAIEAQKTKGRSLKRSVKGKKTVDLGDHHQVPKDQAGHVQAIRTAGAITNVEELGSSVQNFLSSPFGQVPWSMYQMLPTFLTDQIAANQGSDASLYNYALPRSAETKSCMNSERVNQMLEPGSSQGSFPVISPEETIRRFTLMGSRNMDRINQKNTPSSSIGTGFPSPLHQGIDFGLSIPNPRQFNPQNLPQETGKPLGLKMNGGAAKVSGGSYNFSEHITASGSYNFSEHITANNHHSNPKYKSDGRLLSYQMQNLKDGHLFLQQ
ncbi:uncharacterized protein LOC120199707 [Hibiscus syriacus]|uniref:uncharacterized protein LOC120199707 n=1 Tax=Hibiscus syriacus TaxID=106335 RepID=UPI001924DA90|nr:uncharacterized protein LOC120199707 [Hibiscus syriacus]